MTIIDPKCKLAYWIVEREQIRKQKLANLPKPWSDDPVFQKTYFCNVRREDDRVTRWIRGNWSPDKIGWDNYEYAMVMARFLNWPDTLAGLQMGNGEIPFGFDTEWLLRYLENRAKAGLKVWGNAYVVTTHGLAMGKAQYLCRNVLPAVYDCVGAGRWRGQYASSGPLLARRYEDYKLFEGMASFMSAQVIADLKNTPGHPLFLADDWSTWSAMGPGSLRGLEWFHGRKISRSDRAYTEAINSVRDYLLANHMKAASLLLDQNHNGINMQDLQNCLCEFDKYMRVLNGTGRSKRGYAGK